MKVRLETISQKPYLIYMSVVNHGGYGVRMFDVDNMNIVGNKAIEVRSRARELANVLGCDVEEIPYKGSK